MYLYLDKFCDCALREALPTRLYCQVVQSVFLVFLVFWCFFYPFRFRSSQKDKDDEDSSFFFFVAPLSDSCLFLSVVVVISFHLHQTLLSKRRSTPLGILHVYSGSKRQHSSSLLLALSECLFFQWGVPVVEVTTSADKNSNTEEKKKQKKKQTL